MIDKELQRFHHGDDAFISYSVINGDTAVTGNFSVPAGFTFEQMLGMLLSFTSEMAEAYPTIDYITNFPGTKSTILAKVLVTIAKEHFEHHEMYCGRDKVDDCEAFCDEIMACDNSSSWVCRPQGSPIDCVAVCVAIRPMTSMRPMLRYHPIDEHGCLQNAVFTRPSGPFHVTMDSALSSRLETHTVSVGESGSLQYTPKVS